MITCSKEELGALWVEQSRPAVILERFGEYLVDRIKIPGHLIYLRKRKGIVAGRRLVPGAKSDRS